MSNLISISQVRPFLLRISPSDNQQSKAIADILGYYRWLHFSILTSYDPYGIHGISGIQEAASSRNWKVNNIQHFAVPLDIGSLDVTEELDRIKKSESRIIVLNCGAGAAGQVLRQAEKKGLTEKGYAWIVSDGITGNFNELTRYTGNRSIFGKYLTGLVGTIPASRDGKEVLRKFENEFSARTGRRKRDITPYARLAFDSVLVMAHSIDDFIQAGNKIDEENIDFWAEPGRYSNQGPELYNFMKNVVVNGSTKVLSFDDRGAVKNAKYDIVNFVVDDKNGFFNDVSTTLLLD
eukprot:sb/3467568/